MVTTLIHAPAPAPPPPAARAERPHLLADLYQAAQAYQAAFERLHDQEDALHAAHQAARHHDECNPWVLAAAGKLSAAVTALDTAQAQLATASQRAAAAAAAAAEENGLLNAGYDEIAVEHTQVDGHSIDDSWDTWVEEPPGSNSGHYWDVFTTEQLLALRHRGQITVLDRTSRDEWQSPTETVDRHAGAEVVR